MNYIGCQSDIALNSRVELLVSILMLSARPLFS